MGQIQARQHLFDELAAELPLHEAVGGNQPHETRWPAIAGNRQLKNALGERAPQRVLPVATRIALPVGRIQRRILDHDVGRVAHYRVVLPA